MKIIQDRLILSRMALNGEVDLSCLHEVFPLLLYGMHLILNEASVTQEKQHLERLIDATPAHIVEQAKDVVNAYKLDSEGIQEPLSVGYDIVDRPALLRATFTSVVKIVLIGIFFSLAHKLS